MTDTRWIADPHYVPCYACGLRSARKPRTICDECYVRIMGRPMLSPTEATP